MNTLNEKFQIYLTNNNFDADLQNILAHCEGKSKIECDGFCIILMEKHLSQFCYINEIDFTSSEAMRFLATHIINVKNYIQNIIFGN